MDEVKGDPMVRDGKRLPLDSFAVFPLFLLCVFVLFPFWLLFLLPLTLIYQGFSKLVSLFSSRPRPPKSSGDHNGESKEGGPGGVREFDIIVFGATGFTGKMAAKYIARNYGDKVKWGIAGRRRAALEDVRRELAVINKSLTALPIIIADSSDLPSLHNMTSITKVVITTAGAYSIYPECAECITDKYS